MHERQRPYTCEICDANLYVFLRLSPLYFCFRLRCVVFTRREREAGIQGSTTPDSMAILGATSEHVPQGAHCTDPAVLLSILFCLAPVVGCHVTRTAGRCPASSLVQPLFLSTD